eukprot:scaffold46572_cov26-Tisochrysis_lutea.AAC.1
MLQQCDSCALPYGAWAASNLGIRPAKEACTEVPVSIPITCRILFLLQYTNAHSSSWLAVLFYMSSACVLTSNMTLDTIFFVSFLPGVCGSGIGIPPQGIPQSSSLDSLHHTQKDYKPGSLMHVLSSSTTIPTALCFICGRCSWLCDEQPAFAWA